MATDTGQLDLLRKSLDSLKSRFQSVTNPRDKSKAWLIQFNDGHPDGFSALVDKWITHAGKPKPFFCAIPMSRRETRLMRILKSGGMEEEPGHRVPGFKRMIKAEGWDVLGLLAEDAIRLMMAMPDPVQRRIWSHLPLKTEFGGMAQTWVAAVFELAWQTIPHSPLRADKWVPLTDCQQFALEGIRAFREGPFKSNDAQLALLGENPSWYATLPDFAAASVQAIDILEIWLADELKRETEATSEPLRPVEQPTTMAEQMGQCVDIAARQFRQLVLLSQHAFPDLWEPLADWLFEGCKGSWPEKCPEYGIALDRLTERFGQLEFDPLRWGLRLMPPLQLTRWDDNAAIALGEAIRAERHDEDRKRQQSAPPSDEPAKPPAAPKVEGTPVERQAETLVRVPALSEKQYLILETMKELAALSADTRRSAGDIAVACDGKQADVNVFKPLLSDLTKNRKLTESKTGRGGGSWLTDDGVEIASRLVENRKASVSKR